MVPCCRRSCRVCRLQVVCERLGHVVNEDQIRIDMMEQSAVVSELFSSVCAEIRDEVCVLKKLLCKLRIFDLLHQDFLVN